MENQRVRPRRRLKVHLDAALLADVKAMDIDVTAAASAGNKEAISKEKAAAGWRRTARRRNIPIGG